MSYFNSSIILYRTSAYAYTYVETNLPVLRTPPTLCVMFHLQNDKELSFSHLPEKTNFTSMRYSYNPMSTSLTIFRPSTRILFGLEGC